MSADFPTGKDWKHPVDDSTTIVPSRKAHSSCSQTSSVLGKPMIMKERQSVPPIPTTENTTARPTLYKQDCTTFEKGIVTTQSNGLRFNGVKRFMLSAILVAGILSTTPKQALAERLHGRSTASLGFVDVIQWKSASGPIAEKIASTYLKTETFWIGLGYDQHGFWSAEGILENDACGSDCRNLNLVHTHFNGKRKSFPIVGLSSSQALHSSSTVASTKVEIKQRIFKVIKQQWSTIKLKQNYQLQLPNRDKNGEIKKFSGWYVHVAQKGKFALRFRVDSSPIMCWDRFSWNAYPIKMSPHTKRQSKARK
jgi:hypothetical protein